MHGPKWLREVSFRRVWEEQEPQCLGHELDNVCFKLSMFSYVFFQICTQKVSHLNGVWGVAGHHRDILDVVFNEGSIQHMNIYTFIYNIYIYLYIYRFIIYSTYEFYKFVSPSACFLAPALQS